jgi:hypothetical protein
MKSDPEEERNDNDAFDKYHTKQHSIHGRNTVRRYPVENILYVGCAGRKRQVKYYLCSYFQQQQLQ